MQRKKAQIYKKRYEDKDIKDAFLVVAATNNREANKAVFAAAKKYKCLLNIVDKPDESNFIVPFFNKQGRFDNSSFNRRKEPCSGKADKKRAAAEIWKGI